VVGFGNTLVADDGAGPAAVERLRGLGLPAGLRAEQGGEDALRLGRLWEGEADVWLIDALVRGARPGTVHRLGHEEVLAVPQRHAGAHRLSLPECLRWLCLAEPRMAAVRYRLWGVEPEQLDLREGLTPAVAAGVLSVIGEIGEAARRRAAAAGRR